MRAQIGSKVGKRVGATAAILALATALIVGVASASADGGDDGSCVFNGTSYAAGTRLAVGDTTYICQDGAWSPAPERVPSNPPAYDPPSTLTPVTGLKEEFHPVSHDNSSNKFQQTIQAAPHHHFPF